MTIPDAHNVNMASTVSTTAASRARAHVEQGGQVSVNWTAGSDSSGPCRVGSSPTYWMMTIQFSRSSSLIVVTAICAFASDRTFFAQTTPVVQLIKDINPGQTSSDPAGFVTLDGIAYFRANDGTHGFEMWRSDGTEGGTQLVSDLNPGLPHGFPDNLAVANGSLYFTAFNDPAYIGSKVWRSDGSPSGTILLADTYPGLVGGGIFGPPLPRNFTALNANTVVFAALDPVAGLEPWKTDGTPLSTNRIVDLHPGPGMVDPDCVHAFE